MKIKARKVQGVATSLCVARLEAAPRPDRPLLLLLHGALRSLENLLPWAQRWPGEYDVALADLPGHGRSAAPAAVTFPTFVDEIRFLVADSFKDRRVIVIGESLGGVLALAAAGHPPVNLAAVVALDPPLATAKLRPVIDFARGVLAEHPQHAFLRDFLFEMFGVRTDAPTVEDRRYEGALAQVRVPALVLAGDPPLQPGADDAACSLLDDADRARLRDAPLRFEVIAGAGHHLVDRRPDETAAAIGRFLAAL